MKPQQVQPVMVHKRYRIEIHDLTHDGEGAGRHEGFTVFVPDAIPGDVVLARVTSVKKSYARAVVEEILVKSPQRMIPICPTAEWCGGCQLAQMAYKQQLVWKERYVREALARLGKVQAQVLPIIGMELPEGYRNKAEFAVGMVDGQSVVGFYQKGSHRIVDIDYCRIQYSLTNKALQSVKRALVELGGAPSSGLRHVVIKVSFSNHTVMVIFVTRGRELPYTEQLLSRLREDVPELVSVYQNVNPHNTVVVFGDESRLLWGKPYIVEQIGALKYAISPRSFFQVNPIQAKMLYDLVKEAAALTGRETIWDLYCGTGSIGLYLADGAHAVVGVESVADAVIDARLNAKLNGITNARFITGKAEEVAPQLVREGLQPDVVIVDPPRKGCEAGLLETINAVAVPRLVYVSCNPATLARDLGVLADYGYQVEYVQPVDMFPDTAHVECVTLMSRVEK